MRTHLLLITLALMITTAPAAASGAYLGASGEVGACAEEYVGYDIALVCETECSNACDVSIDDAVLGAEATFRVCDWDGTSSVHCSEEVSGTYRHATTTGVIDIYVVTGTTGTITVTDA